MKRSRFFLPCVALCLAACTDQSETVESSEAEIAFKSLSSEGSDGSVTVSPDGSFMAQNTTYRGIAETVLTTTSAAHTLRLDAARLRSRALEATLFPQLTPTVSVNQDGDALGGVQLTQLIYSNGQFQADRDVLRAQEIEALAQYLIDANEVVSEAINAFLDAHYYQQLAKVSLGLEETYRKFVGQAKRRVSGGVGDDTEIATFELKLLEARTEFQEFQASRAQALSEFASLTGGEGQAGVPPEIKPAAPTFETPAVVLAMAQMESSRAELDVERARRRPTISLTAGLTQNLSNGDFDDDIRLRTGLDVPIGVRGNRLDLEASQADFAAASVALQQARSDAVSDRAELEATIRREREQIPTLLELVRVAEDQVEKFDAQFLSGSVSIEEAVSVMETMKRSKTNLADARHTILTSQIEIARLNGQLLPGPVVTAPLTITE